MLGIKAEVPQSTIIDICSGKANLNDCKAGTLHKIAKVLGVSTDYILDEYNKPFENKRLSFDAFRSSACHELKEKGEFYFTLEIIENDKIREYYNKKWYFEAFYLLAMIDYLSRIEDLGLVEEYDDIRKKKLKKMVFPKSIILKSELLKDESFKENAIKKAIPEFLKFNIVEGDIFDVV